MGELLRFPRKINKRSSPEEVTPIGGDGIGEASRIPIPFRGREVAGSATSPLEDGNGLSRRLRDQVSARERGLGPSEPSLETITCDVFSLGEEEGLGRHATRQILEALWWSAHHRGNLDEQQEIEAQIGRVYGVRRGGAIVTRLQISASTIEHQGNNPT